MSGIAGIVRLDGGHGDGRTLRALTQSLSFRGPDRQDVWVDGALALGHASLQTTDDITPHPQPATLDGTVWITADARIDGRDELIDQLESSGRTNLSAADDALLILHAYHAWGDDCVEKLLGDFSFGLWDGRMRRLFCARDHFGVKPFYYAQTNEGFVFSNTLNLLWKQMGVSSALNELAVADFLLFGINQDPATTIFGDIQRLPPAHALTWDQRGARTKRYWSVPTDGRVRYLRASEYVEHFSELLQTAVADRLRSSHVGIWMSGGLDSTSITAVARQVSTGSAIRSEVRAHTVVYDRLIPDEERWYSSMAARSLGVENSVFVADSHQPFDQWDSSRLLVPEPTGDPFLWMRMKQLCSVAAHSRVLLSGEGGDEVLWPSRAIDIAGNLRPVELATDLARSLCFHRRRPAFGLRHALRRRWMKAPPSPPFPEWMNPTLTARLGLRDRWTRFHRPDQSVVHPLRGEAHRRLDTGPWSWYFESSDPGVTHIPVEVRYPFLDVRLVKYLLSIPPIPWFVDKEILRVAMRGTLPDPVRLRRKSPLGGDPLAVGLRQWREFATPRIAAELPTYVNAEAIPVTRLEAGSDDPWLDVRPVCLNFWLNARTHVS